MKHKMTNSIAMALSVLLALMTFVPTTQAQPPEKYVWDTGIVSLGPTEVLRLTVVNFAMADGSVKFRRISYTQDPPNAEGVSKLNLDSILVTGVVPLRPGEGASWTFTGLGPGTYVRAMVLSNTPNLRINAEIIDTTTGQTRVIIALFLP